MTFYEETNPCDVNIGDLMLELRKFFKNVKENEIKFYYHGTYNVFEFRNYILRVPDITFRNERGINLIQNESKKLENLANFLNVPIPQPEILSLELTLPFMLYEKIPGVPLSSVYTELSSKKIQQIAHGIAEFLNLYHSSSLLHQVNSDLFQTRFNVNRYKLFWESRHEEIQEKVYKFLNSKQKIWINKLFDEFLSNSRNFQFTPSLIHGDFDTSNILVNPQEGILTGIVDFEEAHTGDPAADLLFYEQKSLLHELLSEYVFSNSISLENRMKFLYCRTFAPYIVFGLDHHKKSMVSYGLARLEKIRKKFP